MSSNSNTNYPDIDVIHWKYIWNDVISDVDFRNWFVGNKGYYQLFKNLRVDDLSSKETLLANKNEGTFYMQFAGNFGHFVAYKKQKSRIVIFDSSHGTGTFSGCLPDFVETIINKFKLPIFYDTKFGTPQNKTDDSFCQTWSLCYLSKNKDLHKYLKNSKKDPILSLFNICKFFINTTIFEEICNQQEQWINKNLKKNKAPKKWDSQYFLKYSKDMNIDMFRLLFNE